jgi:preprotein translocase subunit SecG
MLFSFITILIVVVSVLLILIVLVQNSKGGGLTSSFASSNQFMGVRKTADFLEKATWTLAGALLFLCIIASFTVQRNDTTPKSAIDEQVKNAPDPRAIPNNLNNTQGSKALPAPAGQAKPAAPAAKK